MVPRNIFGTWKNPSRIKLLAACLVVTGVLGGGAFLGWRLSHSLDPMAHATAAPSGTADPSGTAQEPSSAPTPPPIAPQTASVASIIEVVVWRNDTLDVMFRRMSLNNPHF